MAKKLIIHAGQHKTGSTAIQAYLKHNVAFFKRQGIGLFEGRNKTYNAYELANLAIRDELMTPMRIIETVKAPNQIERQVGIQDFCRTLKNEPCERMLISAEAFSFIRYPQEFEIVSQLAGGLSWKALMFLRNVHSWKESWRSQISQLRNFRHFNAGIGIDEINDESWLTDHIQIRSVWHSHCDFLDYDKCLDQDSSVIPQFLKWLDINPKLAPEWRHFQVNRTKRA
jgi:hypothetical protein